MDQKEERKIKAFIVSKMRLAWRYYSSKRKECLKAERCAKCKSRFSIKNKASADHIVEVVDPWKGFEDWNTYYDRMFNGDLQALCSKCHDIKTQYARLVRRTQNGRNKVR